VAVADETPAPVIVDQLGVGGEERRHLGLDRLRQHPARALAQDGQQRIVPDAPTWPRQPNDVTLLHGVSSMMT
jgi:hypothetical protein